MGTYSFLPIASITLFVYLVSYLFTKTKHFRFVNHRRIWNLLLLTSFLVAGTLGVFMAAIQSFQIDYKVPFSMLRIHVGFGIGWFIVAWFHFIWHLSYFRKSIKVISWIQKTIATDFRKL